MKSTLSFLFLLLASLSTSNAQPRQFSTPSPDQKFEAVCDFDAEPPFKIAEKTSGKLVASMDAERVGNHGLDATWSPDSKTLVVLVEWRLYTEIHVFRLVGDRFERTQGPKAPEDFLTLGRWTAPNKVQMKGEKKSYALVISDKAAKFEH